MMMVTRPLLTYSNFKMVEATEGLTSTATRPWVRDRPQQQHQSYLPFPARRGRGVAACPLKGYERLSLPLQTSSALPFRADLDGSSAIGRYVPCVDGSELAKRIFTSQGLVAATMCSAC